MGVLHDPGLDPPLAVAPRAELLRRLRAVLPATAILEHAEQQRVFECDGQPAYRETPLLTVLPDDAVQVRAVLVVCNALAVPVVTRGSGTGLSGGALPCAQGVLLVMTRMCRVLEIDADSRIVVVQPGVGNLAISQAVKPYGLYYAPDPSSQIACSIGGNVAENAGGVHCLKYGLTVHNVRALDVETIDGETLHIDAFGDGIDLLPLIIGSEGLLGVVTAITVELKPLPPVVTTILAGFASVGAAADAVARVIGSGVIPAGLEMMDQLAIEAAENYIGAGYPRDAAALLLVELDGCATEVVGERHLVWQVLEQAGATTLREAADAAERARFWAGRKSAFPAVGRMFPDYYCMDGTIPRSTLAAMLTRISELSVEFGMPVANVFHAGDGNLHPLILFDASRPGALQQAERFGAAILEHSVALGGAISGEHGVGREKINQMAVQFTDAEIAQFLRIKAAFDPRGLLNPGKGIPTLKRCQEYRATGSAGRAHA